MEAIDFLSIATIAFLGSFGHCVGMCGGIVIAYSSTKVEQGWSKTEQSFSHLSGFKTIYSAISVYDLLFLIT